MSEHLPFTRYGPLDVPGGEDLISRFLKTFGEWSHLETSFVASLLSPGARILDAGAFVGTFGLSMLCRAPALLVSVEANPQVLPLLKANYRRLAPERYCIEHAVLGDELTANRQPHLAGPDNLGSLSFMASTMGPDSVAAGIAETPPGITLSQLRERHGPFDFLKLDIEGAELAALMTDADWLASKRPTLWVECNESPSVFALFDFLHSLGYDVHYLGYPSHNPNNFLRQTQPIFALAHEAGLVATGPGRQPQLDAGLRADGCVLERVADREALRRCLWLTPRWGLQEWVDLPRSQLLALVSRLHRQQPFAGFLKDG